MSEKGIRAKVRNRPPMRNGKAKGNLMPKISTSVTVIAVLALAQALFGVLRAFGWFQVGSDLLGRGLLIVPLIGVLAYARGFFVAGIALLYIVFAFGVFARKSWGWSLGVTVAIINLLLVLSAVMQGESLAQGVLWLIVPVVIVCYLFSAAGRQAFES
jgi:hypothetical protein